MPINDRLSRVSNSATGRPIVATLSAPGKAIGAASITISAATNWDTVNAQFFTIYSTVTVAGVAVKDGSTQTDWKGTLTGTTVSNLTLTGGTDREYSAGAIVELTPTAAYAKELYDHIATQHNQNGTHSSITASGTLAVTGASTFTGAVTLPAATTIVTKEYNPYKFSVYRSAALVSINGSATIAFDTKAFDTGTNVDVVTNKGRFTVPIAGFYFFTARASTIGSPGVGVIALYKNGLEVVRGTDVRGAGTIAGHTVSAPLQLVAGDYIETYWTGSAGNSFEVSSLLCYFTGFLISAT